MQVIYGPGLASNILLTAQKRLVRPAYSNTLAHPYAAIIDPYLRDTSNNIRVPLGGDTQGSVPTGASAAAPLTRAAAPGGTAFTLNNSIIPGLVMVKSGSGQGEYVTVHNGDTDTSNNLVQAPFGLLGQWLGGTFDNVGQTNQVGVWQGYDSVYELLAPAWNDTGLATAFANAKAGQPVVLYAQTDGRLGTTKPQTSSIAIAQVMDRPSSARLVVKLLI